MSVTEQQRHQLFTWFEEAMGSERAAILMDLLPPVGWADVATRHDLLELERRLDLRFEMVDHRFDSLEHKLIGRMHEERVASDRKYVTWLLASNAAILTAIGVVGGLVALG
jgi:hypothetical protein